MPLGTLDRSPPPFFRQGPSALTKLLLCSALAVFLMAADTRFALTAPLRAGIATALLPLQRLLQMPVRAADDALGYLQGFQSALAAAEGARQQLVLQSARAARVEQLSAENARLRALLELRPALAVRSTSAELLYEAADPYSRKLFIDRGERHGLHLGAPVINEAGVLGQVTALYPLSAVVTLLTDRDAAIPVLNQRTQQRSAAYGGVDAGTAMELRFVAGNADVQPGDVLTTSGVDGVYPGGLVVGKVVRVDRRTEAGFARIVVAPAAGIDGVRHVLVLEPMALQLPPRPDAVSASAPAPAKPGRTATPARAAASGASR
jgi:rod shape-determining protein MreC